MKAIITKVSDIDVTGTVFVGFDIQDSKGKVIYASLSAQGDPDTIVSQIQTQLASLNKAATKAALIKVGDVIT